MSTFGHWRARPERVRFELRPGAAEHAPPAGSPPSAAPAPARPAPPSRRVIYVVRASGLRAAVRRMAARAGKAPEGERGDQEEGRRPAPPSADALFEEAFRTLRTNLLLRAAHGERRFVVTSARPREGKTTVATNLAATLAAAGRRVLLVDADLRRPQVHRVFGVPQWPGLAEVLRGRCAAAAVTRPVLDRLSVVPSGELPSDPQELLLSDRLGEALAEWAAGFDAVVMDTPPVLAVADTTLVAPLADGVVLVLRYGQVTEAEARQARERLESARARVVGCVLSHFDGTFGQPYNPYVSAYVSGKSLDAGQLADAAKAPSGGER
jgi:capsular exopolysaccharide synthesis family protein